MAYLVALMATAAMVLLRWLIDPWLSSNLPFVTLFGAVAAAVRYGGYRPAILATAVGFLACDYLFMLPRGTYAHVHDYIGFVLYLLTCLIIIGFGESMRVAKRRADERRELLRVTLTSIGDAVITTVAAGRVTLLNPVAETLTGRTNADAVGQPLEKVFRITNASAAGHPDRPTLTAS